MPAGNFGWVGRKRLVVLVSGRIVFFAPQQSAATAGGYAYECSF